MKIYENVVIGNFLYGLGFAISKQSNSPENCQVVNLLQQTPVDGLLGDVLLTFPGAVRLIEFKTQENKSGKEYGRHRKITAALTCKPELTDISRKIHWYIESAVVGGEFVARTAPYISAYPRVKPDSLFSELIEQTAKEVLEDTATEEDLTKIKEYLELVRMAGGGGEIGTGGLLLVANAAGQVRYAPIHDLLELRLKNLEYVRWHEQLMTMQLAAELGLKGPELHKQLKKQTREIGR